MEESGLLKIFISHSSKDSFVTKFVDFLTSLGINASSIFCSSLPGQGVSNGERIGDSVRKAFDNSSLIIYLVTNNFLKSPYCTQELGAIWSYKGEKKFFIFKFEDVKDGEIKGFIDKSYKYDLVNRDGISSLYDVLSETFELKNKQAIINRAINNLLAALENEIKVLVEDKDKSETELEEERIKALEKQYYDLSAGEKRIIGSIFFSEDAVGYYGLSNGTVGLLETKLFLVRTAAISSGFMQFPYALQPWVKTFIKSNKKVQEELKRIVMKNGAQLDDSPFRL